MLTNKSFIFAKSLIANKSFEQRLQLEIFKRLILFYIMLLVKNLSVIMLFDISKYLIELFLKIILS